MLATGLVSISNEFGVSVQTAYYTTGLYVIGLGIGAIIWSPTAVLYGKRPVYLVGAALLIVSSIWQALSATLRGSANGNAPSSTLDMEEQRSIPASDQGEAYTEKLRKQPELTFMQTVRPWNGTLHNGS